MKLGISFGWNHRGSRRSPLPDAHWAATRGAEKGCCLTSEHRQMAAVDDALAWLEDGLRETKSQLLRLEQSLELNDSRIEELTGKLHAAEDGTAAVSRRLGDFNSWAAQIAQLHHGVAQIEEHAREAERRIDEAMRV